MTERFNLNIRDMIPSFWKRGRVTLKTGERQSSRAMPSTPAVTGFGGAPSVEQMSRQIVVGTMAVLEPAHVRPGWATDNHVYYYEEENGQG